MTGQEENLAQLVNSEIEQSFLGCLLLEPKCFDIVAWFSPAFFGVPVHGKIFDAIKQHKQQGRDYCPEMIAQFFSNDEKLQEVGGEQYLKNMAADVISLAGVRGYANFLLSLHYRRMALSLSQNMQDLAINADLATPPEMILNNLDLVLTEARNLKTKDNIKSAAEGIAGALELARNPTYGVNSGFGKLHKITGGFKPSELITIGGRPGMGKAQPLSAKIKTVNGWTTMGNINVGDEIASIDGKKNYVTGKFPQGEKDIFKVTFHDGRSTECCAEHLWKVKNRKWNTHTRVLQTAEIARLLKKPSYKNRISIFPVNGDFGHNEELPIHPYLLGVLIGDGCLAKNSLIISSPDTFIIQKCQKLLPNGYALKVAGGYDFRLSKKTAGGRNVIQDKIRNMGLGAKRSEEKFIPELYLLANKKQRIDLINGLLDTDGTVERDGTIRYATSSEKLAHDFISLANSLGATCRLSTKIPTFTYKGIKKNGLKAYIISIRHNDAKILISLPRQLKKLPKKYQYSGAVALKIKSITLERRAEACCISVDHADKVYITDDYIPTHNTAMGLTIAVNAAKQGKRVLFFSLEMSHQQLWQRILSRLSHAPLHSGNLHDDEWESVDKAARDAYHMPLEIDDSPSLTALEICSRAAQYKRKNGLDLIIIDYLGFIKASDPKANKVYQIEEITGSLKALAKTQNVPVILLCQLSRGIEGKDDKRPGLADLRDSGCIEQDSDVVMFIYRDEYYKKNKDSRIKSASAQAYDMADENAMKGKAELIVAKNRQNVLGTIDLNFSGERQEFYE